MDVNHDGYHQVGEQLRYTFTLQNVGEVPVRDIVMHDEMLSDTPYSFERQKLTEGETTVLVLTYTITEADMDRGSIINSATVLGKNPRGFDVKDISGRTADDDLPTVLELYLNLPLSEVIAVEDYFELDYNRYADLDVLKNDYTIGGSALDLSSLQLVDFPSNGTVTVDTTGYMRYMPDVNYTGMDYFSYRITDSNGIESGVTQVTMLVKGMFIPNVFSPNGDGNNDTFFILGIHDFDRVSLEVLDRYGKRVYLSNDYMNDWGAEGYDDGIYYYILKGFSKGRRVLHNKGAVTVMRELYY